MRFDFQVSASGDHAASFTTDKDMVYSLCSPYGVTLDKRSAGRGGAIAAAQTSYAVAVGGAEDKPAVLIPYRAGLSATRVSLEYRAEDSRRVKLVTASGAWTKAPGRILYVPDLEDYQCLEEDGVTTSHHSGAIALWRTPPERGKVPTFAALFAIAPGDVLCVWREGLSRPVEIRAEERDATPLPIRDAPVASGQGSPAPSQDASQDASQASEPANPVLRKSANPKARKSR